VLDTAEEFGGIPGDLAGVVPEVGHSRTRANELPARAERLIAVAAARLVGELGLSFRDAAALLSISHRRVPRLPHSQQPRST